MLSHGRHARALAEIMRLGDCLSYPTAIRDYLGIALRSFLAAYVQRACGLSSDLLSQCKLAAWLTEVHDVKMPAERCVSRARCTG